MKGREVSRTGGSQRLTVKVTLFLLFLLSSPNCSLQNCDIISSSLLKFGNTKVRETNISYNFVNKLMGLAFFNLATINNEKINNMQKYNSETGELVCKHTNSELTLNNLHASDIFTNTLKSNEAYVTDLDFYWSKNQLSCQISQPSAMIIHEEKCLEIVNKVYTVLGVAELTDLTELKSQLVNGRNPMYLTAKEFLVAKPNTLVCYHSENELVSAAIQLRKLLELAIDAQEITDTALGTKFKVQLSTPMMACGRRDLEHFMQRLPSPEKIKHCFNLDDSQNTVRKKRFSLMEIGGQDGASEDQVDEINSNFEKLTENQQTLLKRFISLGIDEKIQTKLLTNHEENMKLLASRVAGMELKASINQIHREAFEHLVTTVKEVVSFVQQYIKTMKRFQSEISELLEAKLYNCKEFHCQDNEDVHIVVHKTGVKVVSYGRDLQASGGFIPACTFHEDKVNKFHLKHMTRYNSSHFQTANEEIVEEACLKNNDQCKEEDMRNLQSSDFIDGKVFLIPSGKEGFLVQCKPDTILITETGFLKCTKTPTGVQLPVTTSEGSRIGMEVLKVQAIKGGPRRQLSDVALEMFKSSSLEFREMMALDKSWKRLSDTEEINDHHWAYGLGAFSAISIVIFISCICKIICNCVTTGKPCSGPLSVCNPGSCKKGDTDSEEIAMGEMPAGKEADNGQPAKKNDQDEAKAAQAAQTAEPEAKTEKKVIVDLGPWLKPPRV